MLHKGFLIIGLSCKLPCYFNLSCYVCNSWKNTLDQKLNFSAWSYEEDKTLWLAVQELGEGQYWVICFFKELEIGYDCKNVCVPCRMLQFDNDSKRQKAPIINEQ